MSLIGVELARIDPGEVELRFANRKPITQQHGFVHGGIMASVLDTACGIATLTLMPEDAGILTIEFKVNLLAPGSAPLFKVIGRVRKQGRTIWLVEGEAFGLQDGRERLVATMTATEMTMVGRAGVRN